MEFLKTITVKKKQTHFGKHIDKIAGKRLLALQRTFGKDNIEMSKIIKKNVSTWSKYKHGHLSVPKDVIIRLSEHFSVSKLWLSGYDYMED